MLVPTEIQVSLDKYNTMADITPARKLFDLLVSRDFDPEMLDASGRPAEDPSNTEIFSFDFRARSGKDYGTVVIMLGNDNELEVYCSDNVGRSMEINDKNDWFEFLAQLKNFATRNFMSFGIKNLNRLRYSMQGQAAINEGLFESWAGKRDVSWNAGPTESRLMIKHKRTLGEDEARFRYVESLFIEQPKENATNYHSAVSQQARPCWSMCVPVVALMMPVAIISVK